MEIRKLIIFYMAIDVLAICLMNFLGFVIFKNNLEENIILLFIFSMIIGLLIALLTIKGIVKETRQTKWK